MTAGAAAPSAGWSPPDPARFYPDVAALGGLGPALEAAAAGMTESEWQHLRTEAASRQWREHQALIEPALRDLYPCTGHSALRLSTTTHPLLTAGEAVAPAVSLLPPGLGPVTFGAQR